MQYSGVGFTNQQLAIYEFRDDFIDTELLFVSRLVRFARFLAMSFWDTVEIMESPGFLFAFLSAVATDMLLLIPSGSAESAS